MPDLGDVDVEFFSKYNKCTFGGVTNKFVGTSAVMNNCIGT